MIASKQKGKKTFGRYKKAAPLFIMMLPGLIYILINNYFPMIGLYIAFKNINYRLGFLNSPWVGFDNFKYLFASTDAFVITRNTILYNVAFILINTGAAIIIALMLAEIVNKGLLKAYQTVILLPFMLSMIIISYLVNAALNSESGFFNKVILAAMGREAIMWYSEPKYWPAILIIIKLWSQVGYLCVVFFAAIVGINKEFIEAAVLDGATKWQQISKITIPLITPVITMMVLLSVGRIFYSDFGLFYQVPMVSGVLYPVTNVIDTYVYRGLMQLGDIGMSSAAGFYQSLVGFVLVLTSNMIVRKVNPDNALF